MAEDDRKRVCVVVLGDIGRSPRMCYHAASLHRHGYSVELVGYGDSRIACLAEPTALAPNYVRATYVKPVPEWLNNVKPGFLALGLKVLWQFFTLFWALSVTLGRKPLVSGYLVQNPPGLPALAVVWTVARIQGAKFLVDWHNYTDTILALRLGLGSLPVRIARRFENGYGRRADACFCVSKAMQRDLFARRNVIATVFYDRPPPQFLSARRQTLQDRHKLLLKLGQDYPQFLRGPDSGGTILTNVNKASLKVEIRPSRPALLVSSTSWTADEDFGILLDALVAYNILASDEKSCLPSLVAVVTGKGPQKEMYLERIQKLGLDKVEVIIPWLSVEDYPRFLALADLGVCLHTSSSGLDLPMKVVDMLGAGVPIHMLQVITPWLPVEDYPRSLALADLGVCLHTSSSGLDLPMKVVDMLGAGVPVHMLQVITPWLPVEDYPRFLALADLGVCLHTSSSGLDLPMKVVDMLGAGVPVHMLQVITPWLPVEDYPRSLALADLGVCLHTSSSGLDLPMKVVDMLGAGVPVHMLQVITPWLPVEDYPRSLALADLGVCLHTSSSGLDLPMKVVDMLGAGVPVHMLQVITPWLPVEDYPRFLALADLGVCLHTSSSGLDLPMKVVDMLGARVPVHMLQVITPWLPVEDYPRFLALADLGVCLHTSSSGLDLPMKVVDMLGAGVPVLAKRYQCIDELLTDGVNGCLFDTPDELAGHLIRLLRGFDGSYKSWSHPNDYADENGHICAADGGVSLEKLRNFPMLPSWNEEWDKEGGVAHVLRELLD